MVDPVIDEHFRRSLGADYMNLCGKRSNQMKSPSSASTIVRKNLQLSPSISPISPEKLKEKSPETRDRPDENDSISKRDCDKSNFVDETVDMSVDDHFAKALGDTWKQLQQNKSQGSTIESDQDVDDNSGGSMNDSIMKVDDLTSSKVDPKTKNNSESQNNR